MRALLLSDTHQFHYNLNIPTSGYSMVIHTGDFTNMGKENEIDYFLDWYSKIPCKYKILIAGNHDLSLDDYTDPNSKAFTKRCKKLGIIYLQDSSVVIEGVKFYGSPRVPRFYDWAFMHTEKELKAIYKKIPEDTDVLLTHGPALRKGDEVSRGHVGSEALIDRIIELPKLKYHIFGHIHECSGYDNKCRKLNKRFINASSVNQWHEFRPHKLININ